MKGLTNLLTRHFSEMSAKFPLYRVDAQGELLWMAYMEGFGQDPKFRDPNSSIHNCNWCHHFINNYGNIVAINDKYELISIWDIENVPEEYTASIKKMKEVISVSKVNMPLIITSGSYAKHNYSLPNDHMLRYLGQPKNTKRYTKEEAEMYGVVKPNQTIEFNHLYLTIPKSFITVTNESAESLISTAVSTRGVFDRLMKEIDLGTLELVVELIEQNSILNGIAHVNKIKSIIKMKKEYDALDPKARTNWTWVKSKGYPYAHFRSELIGKLCVDIQEGGDLNKVIEDYNKLADPVNYKRATTPITNRQKEEARKFVEQNGYEESFIRRCATIDDIAVSEILHINSGEKKVVSIFDSVKVNTDKVKVDTKKLPSVPIAKFMSDILPGAQSVEVYLQAKHHNNFVTLITANDKESKPIFKWSNNFSWNYNGDLAGKSQIAEAVKSMGGNIDAPVRCSMIWNEHNDAPMTDLDLHCVESHNDHIFFAAHNINRNMDLYDRCKSVGGGVIDIDITRPQTQTHDGIAVENIFYYNIKDGVYKFYIHNFNKHEGDGVRAEIYINGETYQYEFKGRVTKDIVLATLTVKNGKITIEHGKYFTGEGEEKSENIYGLDTAKFHPVTLMCLSPNYWKDEVGNKHYFFFLKDCKAPYTMRGFHTEFLNGELSKHRKVLEVLSSTIKVESTDNQLSGLGFNATVEDELIVRVNNKLYKIKF